MGQCCSSSNDVNSERAVRKRDQQIDEQLKKDRQQMGKEVKLLLLGAGESGKSTLLKQMQIIHGGGFSKEERLSYREIIYSNVIESMKAILIAMHRFDMLLDRPEEEYEVAFDVIDELPVQDMACGYDLPSEVALAIKLLWEDESVVQTYDRRNEYQLHDSAAYYFDAIDRISKPDYIPSDQDVLQTRVKTIGISETRLEVGPLTYRMVDVGGQRSERKKWIHCFEDVTAIIFMVAISEYDQVLFEDESVNRMTESLTLFQSICNMEIFAKTSMILFMNKTDLFKKKLKTSPLKMYFPKYKGGSDYDSASRFLMQQFQNLTVRDSGKQVYTHFTCATDTRQITFVMSAVNDIILQSTLRDVGLL